MSIPVTIKNTCYLQGDIDGFMAEATMKGFEDEKILDMTVRELLAAGLAAFEATSSMMKIEGPVTPMYTVTIYPVADIEACGYVPDEEDEDITEDFVNGYVYNREELAALEGEDDDYEA